MQLGALGHQGWVLRDHLRWGGPGRPELIWRMADRWAKRRGCALEPLHPDRVFNWLLAERVVYAHVEGETLVREPQGQSKADWTFVASDPFGHRHCYEYLIWGGDDVDRMAQAIHALRRRQALTKKNLNSARGHGCHRASACVFLFEGWDMTGGMPGDPDGESRWQPRLQEAVPGSGSEELLYGITTIAEYLTLNRSAGAHWRESTD